MIEAVFFDLDETLFARTESMRQLLADQHRKYLYATNVATSAWCEAFVRLDQRGMVNKSIVYAKLVEEFALSIELASVLNADFRERYAAFAVLTDGAQECLSALQAKGMPIGIITNGEASIQRRAIEGLGVQEGMACVLISGEIDIRKPDPRIFRLAVEAVGLQPDQCLFVGDSAEADVLGACSAGLHAAWCMEDRAWPLATTNPALFNVKSLAELPGLLGTVNKSNYA